MRTFGQTDAEGVARSRLGKRHATVGIAVMALMLLAPAGSRGSDPPCKVKANEAPAKGRAISPPISLTAEPAVGTVNFGTSRGTKSLYVVVKASRRLPKLITPRMIEIAVPRPPQRVSDTLESASLDFPTFSQPRFINGRREIQFRVCIDGSRMKPGSYTSQIFVGGPRGLHGTSITATITAKTCLFWLGGILVLLAALVLLIAMVQQDMKHVRMLVKVIVIGGSLVTAGSAMYAIYASDPAWGADPITSIFALGGTAFGAAGIGSFVTTIFKRGEDESPANGNQPEPAPGPPAG